MRLYRAYQAWNVVFNRPELSQKKPPCTSVTSVVNIFLKLVLDIYPASAFRVFDGNLRATPLAMAALETAAGTISISRRSNGLGMM